MLDVRQQIEQQRTGIEEIMAKIPGFQGYADRELRREADKVVRDHIVARLDQAKAKIEQARQNFAASLKLDDLGDVDRAAQQLMIVTDKVRYANRGYSGMFDAVKIDETKLDQVYTHDASMVDQAEAADASAEAVATATDARAALADFAAKLQAIEQSLQQREDLLRGVV